MRADLLTGYLQRCKHGSKPFELIGMAVWRQMTCAQRDIKPVIGYCTCRQFWLWF